MIWTKDQIDTTLRSVIERSITDPSFRHLAVTDAKAAIAKVTPNPIGDLKVRFVDNAGYDMTIVLPEPSVTGNRELRDDDLAGVSGGITGPLPIATNGPPLCAPQNTTFKPNSPAFCPH